jgi:hypothetical protein
MKKTEQRKEPPFRLENGKKIYSLTSIINCSPRKVPAEATAGSTQNAATTPPADGNSDAGSGSESAPGQSAGNPDEVRVLTRLVSAVKVWCWNEYLGPMYVDFSHNNGAAVRQIPDLVNSAARPVPLMWNHTDDIRAKAGRVVDASWENSSDIPAGANAYLVVNRKYDPKAALGLELGELNATSIGVDSDKVRSHPDLDFYTFMDLQGKVVDGVEVAWLVIAAKAVIHHALVTDGADPYSGPREEQSTQNAAKAASHTQSSEGDRGMEEQLRRLLETWSNAIGINVALGPGSAIPDTLEKRGVDGITALRNAQGQYNELASKLQGLGASLLKAGETTLSAADVLNRLPERIDMARHGEAFLKNQQELAVGWFDKAKTDPANPQNMSDVDKRERERIANCSNMQELADKIGIYEAAAKARFGPTVNMRSSVGEDVTLGQMPLPTQNADQLLRTAMLDRFMPRAKEGGK